MEQRCALRVQHGARALPCRSGERADKSNIPNTLVPGSWLMVLRTRSPRDCWEGQVATLVYSTPMLRSHASVAPLWTDSLSVWATHRPAAWRQSSLHGKMVLH